MWQMRQSPLHGVTSSPHPFDVLLQLDKRIRERAPAAAAGAQLSEISGRFAARLGAWNLLFSMDDVAEIIPIPVVLPGCRASSAGCWASPTCAARSSR
jgi:hypothetical protein